MQTPLRTVDVGGVRFSLVRNLSGNFFTIFFYTNGVWIDFSRSSRMVALVVDTKDGLRRKTLVLYHSKHISAQASRRIPREDSDIFFVSVPRQPKLMNYIVVLILNFPQLSRPKKWRFLQLKYPWLCFHFACILCVTTFV